MKPNIINFDELLEILKQKIKSKNINSSNLIDIIPDVLEVVEKTNQ